MMTLHEHGTTAAGRHVRIWLWAGITGSVAGVVIAWLLAYSLYSTNYVYGRPLVFPVLLVLAGVISWTRGVGRFYRAVRVLGWLTAVGLALISVGLIGDYWIGQRNNVTLWRLGFLFDSMGSQLALFSSTALGVVLLRAPSESRLAAAALISVIPLMVGLAFVMEGYIPSFPVAALCIVWGLRFTIHLRHHPLATSSAPHVAG